MNAFHVIGGLFAVWAVTLTAIGIRREDFPRPGLQTVAVGTISVLLAASSIGSGIITSALEEEGMPRRKRLPRGKDLSTPAGARSR